jgi:hypothetical protein
MEKALDNVNEALEHAKSLKSHELASKTLETLRTDVASNDGAADLELKKK